VKRKYSDSSRLFYLKDGIELDDYDLIFLKDQEELCFSHKGEDFSYKQILSKYSTISKLGQGGFGKVYLIEEKDTKTKYAIKYIDISFFMSKADLVKEIFRESKTLSVLQHKNIISLKRTFLHKNDIVLIMEYAPDGELKNYVIENRGVTEIGKTPKILIILIFVNFLNLMISSISNT
jgi:serine/threonine protein kinase